MADTCGTCIFYHETNECRFAAPIMSQAPFNRWPVAQATDWCGDGISTSDAHRFSAKIYGVEWAALTASLVALAQAYSPAAPAAPSGGSDAIPTGP